MFHTTLKVNDIAALFESDPPHLNIFLASILHQFIDKAFLNIDHMNDIGSKYQSKYRYYVAAFLINELKKINFLEAYRNGELSHLKTINLDHLAKFIYQVNPVLQNMPVFILSMLRKLETEPFPDFQASNSLFDDLEICMNNLKQKEDKELKEKNSLKELLKSQSISTQSIPTKILSSPVISGKDWVSAAPDLSTSADEKEQNQLVELLAQFKNVNYYLARPLNKFRNAYLKEIKMLGKQLALNDQMIDDLSHLLLAKLKKIDFIGHYTILRDKDNLTVSDEKKFNHFIYQYEPYLATPKSFITNSITTLYPHYAINQTLKNGVEQLKAFLSQYSDSEKKSSFVKTALEALDTCLAGLKNNIHTCDPHVVMKDVGTILTNLKTENKQYYASLSFASIRQWGSKLIPILTKMYEQYKILENSLKAFEQKKNEVQGKLKRVSYHPSQHPLHFHKNIVNYKLNTAQTTFAYVQCQKSSIMQQDGPPSLIFHK